MMCRVRVDPALYAHPRPGAALIPTLSAVALANARTTGGCTGPGLARLRTRGLTHLAVVLSHMSTMNSYSDSLLFIAAITTCVIIHTLLKLILPTSSVPLLVSVFLFSNMLSRLKLWSSLVDRTKHAITSTPTNTITVQKAGEIPPGPRHFDGLPTPSKIELLAAIKSLESYTQNSRKTSERRRKLFKMMSWRQQKLCEDVGYSARLDRIDRCYGQNQKVLNAVAAHAISHYSISYEDFDLLKANVPGAHNVSTTNYRVVEALGHFVRDWSAAGAAEIDPLLEYIGDQLRALIPPDRRAATAVVVPGSGVGRIAHDIAAQGDWGSVDAVEFSGLMHICNQFIYGKRSQENENHSIFPYVHSCSNFANQKSQFRSVDLDVGVSKPTNLNLHHHDFRNFKLPHFDNVVVVSAFFIDTAENIIDYFDAINQLATPSKKNPIKNGFWINVGPLKYGTAAQAELTAEEIARIRVKSGWQDVDYQVSTEEGELAGYITNKESLWQGYYGLVKWAAKRRENK